jgi:hypothetical protein
VIGRHEFGVGLAFIAAQVRHPVSELEVEAFYDALSEQTSAEEWRAFVRVAVARYAWRFLPGVAELLDALREFRGEPSLDSEAIEAYERVLESAYWTPEGGSTWGWRTINTRCGRAAADAFLEAGGHHAFASSYHEHDRRVRFVRAYVQAARSEPSTRLLPPAREQAALPPAAATRAFEAGEADGLLSDLGRRLAPRPLPRTPVLVEADGGTPRAHQGSDRRVARQACCRPGASGGIRG